MGKSNMAVIATNMASKMPKDEEFKMTTINKQNGTNMATVNIQDGWQNGCRLGTSPIIAIRSTSEENSGVDSEQFVHQILQKCLSNSYEHEKPSWIYNYRLFSSDCPEPHLQ